MAQELDAPDDKAIQLAKAELRDVERKISLLETERMRIEMQKGATVRERDRLRAFIDLYARFVQGKEPERPKVAAAVFGAASEAEASGKPDLAPVHEIQKPKRGGRRKSAKVDRKPDNIPTMPEMILAALKAASAHGKRGLKPAEIKDFIARKWWPTVKGTSVGPIAWRMYDRKELGKSGETYTLPLMMVTPLSDRKEAAE